MTLKEQILSATDALAELKRKRATYDELKAAAIVVLELRQQAEQQHSGKVKTKVNGAAISALLR